jgi:hypothetical protein
MKSISDYGEFEAMESTNLLQQVGCQHQNFGVWSKALYCSEIPDSFLEVFGG